MGSSMSTQQMYYSIEGHLKTSFDGKCSASAASQQSIVLDGVSIKVAPGCEMNFTNNATVSSTCDIGGIIDALAQAAVSTNENFAKALMAPADASSFHSSTETEKVLNVTKNLKLACESEAVARQSILIKGANLSCTAGAQMNFTNNADVRAICLRTLLSDAAAEAAENAAVDNPPPVPPNGFTTLDHDRTILLLIAVLVFIVCVMVFLATAK